MKSYGVNGTDAAPNSFGFNEGCSVPEGFSTLLPGALSSNATAHRIHSP